VEAQWIAECTSAALTAQSLRRDPGARWRLRELPRLQSLLRKWLNAERCREPFKVETVEQRGELVIAGGPTLKVRIDRIDRLADGSRILIDYKSGMAIRDWQGERPDNPQLPVYAILRPEGLVAVAYAQVNAAECKFVMESERAGIFKPGRRKTSLEGMADLAALQEIWAQRITKIGQEFAAGHAEVAPTVLACRSCNLQGLCRIPSGLDDDDE
jgi:RecB family exonuclease